MSVRSDRSATKVDENTSAIEAAVANSSLAEGSGFSIASPDNPLKRSLVVSIRASLNQLCLQKQKGVWSPSTEALKSMLQQKKFTSLDVRSAHPCDIMGAADTQGDLKSVVLHDLSVNHVVSTFPISLGAKITGVDDHTFSSTGEAYSMIVLPNSNSAVQKKLQADDVTLAYDFARKFPGYTGDNLSEKGIHEVNARRFVLVSADHPIVSAISENADRLQMGEISMMPEGLVKISQGLYESILPLVKSQVESQIKVRDMSRATVSVSPAEYATWSDARADMMTEAKRPLKAQLEAELSATTDKETISAIRAGFEQREKAIEHDIDFKPMNVHLSLDVSYNFLSK